MNFSSIYNNTENDITKKIIDSILSSGMAARVVVDKSTFEILYMNERSVDLIGDRVGCHCYEIFSTSEVPCLDCPINNLAGANNISIRDKYMDLLDQNTKWQYEDIDWIDGNKATLMTLINIGDYAETTPGLLMNSIINSNFEKREVDSLTLIPNSTKFFSNAENTFRYNTDTEYAVVVFDIDRFKTINDIYGMTKGDETLKYIGRVLKDTWGYDENYGRLHSDMFAFYIPYEKKGDIIKVIEKLRKKISNNTFGFDINTSYGIYPVDDRTVPINLMCDRAMMASRTTKGSVLKFCAFYDEQYRADMLKTEEIEKDMQKALDNREFKMYLQPKYSLHDNSLCGAEVLCRWMHPTKGIIPPNDFIPLFERNGFILKLDEYMWEEACKTLAEWKNEGKPLIPLSVNISRYHIQHNDLENVFMRLISKYDIPPALLNLEITESIFLDKPEELNRVLVRLQDLGFKLEVDDFGSGFSSLNLIRNITVDTIKIDKEFLDSEISSEKGKIVVNHTIDMAKDLKLQVIAEGVETKEHVDFLKNSNCDIAQGFYFAKPMPIETFTAQYF